MNLSIRDGAFYADNVFLCYAGAGNGRPNIPHGRFEVATQFSHVHGKVLANVYDLGWIGASPECDIVLGGVVGRSGVIPSRNPLGRLLAMIQAKEDMGSSVTLGVA